MHLFQWLVIIPWTLLETNSLCNPKIVFLPLQPNIFARDMPGPFFKSKIPQTNFSNWTNLTTTAVLKTLLFTLKYKPFSLLKEHGLSAGQAEKQVNKKAHYSVLCKVVLGFVETQKCFGAHHVYCGLFAGQLYSGLHGLLSWQLAWQGICSTWNPTPAHHTHKQALTWSPSRDKNRTLSSLSWAGTRFRTDLLRQQKS